MENKVITKIETCPADGIFMKSETIPAANLPENQEWGVVNFFDDVVLGNILDGVDIVIHSLSTINPGNSNNDYMRGYSKDFIQTIKLAELVIKKNIKMIFLSSGGTVYGKQTVMPIKEDAYPLPINHYGNVKLCIENVLRTFNVQLHTKMLIARISNPYGPGQDFNKGVGFVDACLKKSIKGETIEIWGDGTTARDYIYIDDVCNMIAALIEYDGNEEVFNISSNTAYSQKDIISMIQKFGLNPVVEYKPGRSVDVKTIALDNTKIKKIYEGGITSLHNGMKMYFDYLVQIGR